MPKVLDHGFIELVDYMGNDQSIIDAARVSIAGEGVKQTSTNEQLIRYLMRMKHCYTPNMQVLTASGWKRWEECSKLETFLIPHPNSKLLIPENLLVKSFDVENEILQCFANNRMSFKVTSNHKMYFKPKYESSYQLVEASKMCKWGHFESNRGYKQYHNLVNPDLRYSFIGFYLGDGSYQSKNRISFRLKKERKINYIIKLLIQLNIKFVKKLYNDITIINIVTPQFIKNYLGNNLLCKSKNKNLSKVLIDLTHSEQLGLWEGLVNSDGHINLDKNRIEFSSTSNSLLNIFEMLSILLGYNAHRIDINDIIVGRIYCYLSNKTSLEARKQYFYTEKYSGKVFCTTSSNGLLLVRGESDEFSFVCGNSSPFEMVEFKFRVKAPIFVARQWMRHRTSSINEISARYSELPDQWYVPDENQIQTQADKNKQGRSGEILKNDNVDYVAQFDTEASINFQFYKQRLKDGMAREIARNNLPLSTYTMWIWKINLHNLFHFLKLRMSDHAQWEIREYANTMAELIQPIIPLAFKAFEDYTLNSVTLTTYDMKALTKFINHQMPSTKEDFPTKRELEEYLQKLEIIFRSNNK